MGGNMSGRRSKKSHRNDQPFWRRHSLTIVETGILAVWFLSYVKSDPHSHIGSFFGNAMADWTGVVITILATKWFFEKGSKESRQPREKYLNRIHEFIHEHSLTIFLFATGIGWVAIFSRVDPESKWGTVVSNIVS